MESGMGGGQRAGPSSITVEYDRGWFAPKL